MLLFLKSFSKSRLSWLLLLMSSIVFLGCGFYFQLVVGLNPCHLCIVQRIAFLIIGLAGIVAVINPRFKPLRYLGLLLWGGGSALGAYIGSLLVYTQAFPVTEFISTCSGDAESLMSNFPILKTFPMMFEAKGSCTESSWNFLGLATMEQLTLLIFIAHVLSFVAVFVSQYKKD